MRWFVYFLRCADGSLYCGMTNDLDGRLKKHGRGEVKYTRGRLPVEMVWSARSRTRSSALKREYKLKQLSRADKLKLIRDADRLRAGR